MMPREFVPLDKRLDFILVDLLMYVLDFPQRAVFHVATLLCKAEFAREIRLGFRRFWSGLRLIFGKRRRFLDVFRHFCLGGRRSHEVC